MNLNKLLILFPAWGFCASPVFGEAQTIEIPHNIQIAVETRQAGFQNQAGMQINSQSNQTQFIVVSEGMEGRIFLGESVPYAVYYQNYLTREGYLVNQEVGFQFKDVGTSLIVRARVLGEGQIEVTLTPEISYESQDGRRSIVVQRMSTSVIAPAGQSMEIGGNITQSEFSSNFYRNASGQVLQIVLTPRIMS